MRGPSAESVMGRTTTGCLLAARMFCLPVLWKEARTSSAEGVRSTNTVCRYVRGIGLARKPEATKIDLMLASKFGVGQYASTSARRIRLPRESSATARKPVWSAPAGPSALNFGIRRIEYPGNARVLDNSNPNPQIGSSSSSETTINPVLLRKLLAQAQVPSTEIGMPLLPRTSSRACRLSSTSHKIMVRCCGQLSAGIGQFFMRHQQ